MRKLQEPLNTEERYLYGINVRLNILIEMFSSFLDVYAKEKEVPTSENTVVEEVEVEEEISIEEVFDEYELVGEDSEDTIDKVVDFNSLTKSQIIDYLDYNEVDYNKNMLKAELVELAEKNI